MPRHATNSRKDWISPLLLIPISLFSLTPLYADERPNILFISIDDLNDWVGCLGGHPQVQTPNIDRLAARGANFTNAHCQAPICNPSRISMLLGKLPSSTGHYFLAPGFRDVEVTREAETLFQYFQRNGYRTESMGKIFHKGADAASFDHVEKARGIRRPKKKLHYTVQGAHPGWDWGEIDIPDHEQLDYKTAEWAAERIPELREEGDPFVLAVGFHLPHVPIYATGKWFDLYPQKDLVMPPSLAKDLDDVPPIAVELSLNPTAPRHEWMVESGEAAIAVQSYLASISFVDHLVGMLLDSLEAAGISEETQIVLFSDHGFHMGEKNKWAKRSLWTRATRVPLIFAGPGVAAGAVCDAPVGLIDVFPTLSELAGLPVKDGLDGHSLAPLLADPEATWPHHAVCTFGPGNHSIHSRDYHYIQYRDGSRELYDRHADPDEFTNLAAREDLDTVIAELRRSLPDTDASMVPESRGSDSPLYGEADGLQNAMKRKKK